MLNDWLKELKYELVQGELEIPVKDCLLYTSDAADD